MKITHTLEMKRNILSDEDFFEKATREEMLNFIERNFTPHAIQYDGGHYCKNIKYHSIDGFTDKEKDRLFDYLEEAWDTLIIPAMREFEHENGVNMYTKGRMAGWLYIDDAKVLDDIYTEEQQEGEDLLEYYERIQKLRNTFRILYRFQEWYEIMTEEVRRYIHEEKQEDEIC
jgi:hypothetical protein